jgi:type I restriction enzyme S subunit
VHGGGTPSTKVEEYWEGGTHYWLTPKDLSGMKHPILLSTARKITDKGLDKISSGLLPVGTVLLSSRAPVGYLVLSGVPTAINQGFIAMVCDGVLPPLYVFHWTQSVMDEIKSRASGTTFPEISKTAFRPIKVCVPTKPILESFTAAVEPLFEKLAANIRESQSLEKLRDYLLPKLLSGEVCVQVGPLPTPAPDKSETPSNKGADNV